MHWSYLCTWYVNLSVSFSPFKFVVLWIQGWILFCSEACAFNNCSLFVEWMDEWAIMRNNTFSCHTALKPFLVSHQFREEGRSISLCKGQIDVRSIETHGIVICYWTSSKVLFVLPTPCGSFFWRPSNSLRQPCPSLHRSDEKNRIWGLTWASYF